MGKDEYRPLMSSSDDGVEEVASPKPRWLTIPHDSPWRRRLVVIALIAQGLLNTVLIASGIYLYSRRGPSNPIFPQLLYSPAQDVLDYKVVKFYEGFGENVTIYQLDPSDEVDKAWEDLYSFGISEVPRSVAAQIVNKTYPIAGSGGNYIVELDVFHQLHCLNTLRMAYSPEYYMKKNLTELEKSFLMTGHIRHCLDSIRQSLMCNTDVSTYVWEWKPISKTVKPTGNVVHTCRDFDKIRDWAKAHHIHSHFDNTLYVEDDLQIPIIYA